MQMRTVAERAGVALGTLYRYFPSKMDLVVAVVSEEIDLLETSIERRPPASATPAGRAVDLLMRATRGLMREPELADALIRSLIVAEVQTPFGDRLARLLLRAAVVEARANEGAADRIISDGHVMDTADAETGAADAGGERLSLAESLAAIWVYELLEMLRGQRTYDEIQARIELAAERLLADL